MCFVCCRCATCRKLICTGDTDVCRGPRPNNKSLTALLAGERLEGDLLGAAPTKAIALISFPPLVAAALLVTGTFRLALAFGGQVRDRCCKVDIAILRLKIEALQI